MSSHAENGYGQVRRQTASPRSIEQQLLRIIAAEIEAADPETPEGYRALATAITRNNDLWTAFATDLASRDNPIDPELKGNLLKLAAFSLSFAMKVLRGEEDRMQLVDINRTVAGGLGSVAEAA